MDEMKIVSKGELLLSIDDQYRIRIKAWSDEIEVWEHRRRRWFFPFSLVAVMYRDSASEAMCKLVRERQFAIRMARHGW